MNNTEKIYSFYLALFITMIVLTNIIGVKLFEIFSDPSSNFLFTNSITLTTGLITYPLTFLITDIVCEVLARRKQVKWFF